MSLAFYGTLVAGPSGVATVRFSTPVVLQTIRIIPAGVPAFKNVPGRAGETSPSHFSLKIYSNALMLPTDAEPKPKASNTLLSTQLDYVDEMLDWNFAVSPPASSRLVIFHGSFDKVTIAIYGQLLSDQPTEHPTVAAPSAVVPVITPHSLPASIDVASLPDSLQTAKSLLAISSTNPSLGHVFHSLLCYVTTPEGPFDEWDEASGNPLERLLESDTIDAVELMQEAIQALRKLLPDVEENTATQFTSLVNESLGENPDVQTCKLFFEILGYASLQSDSLVTAILYGISTVTYLSDPRLLQDDETPKHIERWISHPLVARYLNESDIREYMLGGREQSTSAENMARWEQLQSSIANWGDFYLVFDEYDQAPSERIPRVSRWIRRSLAQRHFGPTLIWRLWNQPGIVDFASGDSALQDYANLMLGAQTFLDDTISMMDVFCAGLKAHMGIAAVLSVVWWSRFPPDAIACRAMSVLKLWAESTGIRQLVRALVLAPIFHEALSELTVDVPLHKSGLYAQQLLESLNVAVEEAEEPAPEVAPATPEPPQLSGHLQVMSTVLKQAKLDDVAVKRISLAGQRILSQVKETPDEPWSIFADALQSTTEPFMLTQIEVLVRLEQFMLPLKDAVLDAPLVGVMSDLLTALVHILETISILLPHANLAIPAARRLIRLAGATFVSSDLVVSRNRRQAQVVELAHLVRQACVQFFRTFTVLDASHAGFVYPGAEHVVPMLLAMWTESDLTDSMHITISQTAFLLDLLLPRASASDVQDFWVREVVRFLPQVEQLLAVVSSRHWTCLVSHLIELDHGDRSIDLGAWIALNEVHALKALVARITLDAGPGKLAVMLRVANRSISLLAALFQGILPADSSRRIAELLMRDSRAVATLVQCFEVLVDHHTTTAATAKLAASLAPHVVLDQPRALRRLLTIALLRGCRVATPFSFFLAIPQLLVPHHAFATRDMDLEVFGTDIGLALAAVCAAWNDNVQPAVEIWDGVVRTLEWLVEAESEGPSVIHLHGIDDGMLDTIKSHVERHLAPDRAKAFDLARAALVSSLDVPDDLATATSVVADPAQLLATIIDVRAALDRTRVDSRESTPQPGHSQFDLLALASLSPRAPTSPVSPSAPLSLTKMYSQNEFRMIRHSPSARLNTSRPPSQHVDDWQAQVSDDMPF